MVKKRKLQVDYYLQPENLLPSTSTVKHVHYSIPNASEALGPGVLKSQTSYVHVTRSTPKQVRPDEEGFRPSGEADGSGEEIYLDKEYLTYLAEAEVEGESRATTAKHMGNPLQNWIEHQDVLLRELIRLEGRGDYNQDFCVACQANEPLYRCKDCMGKGLFCQQCTVRRHAETITHRIEKWTGSYFQRIRLRDLGLRVQLGHPVGEMCCSPRPASGGDFVLLDTNGIHLITLDYCGCETAQLPFIQLLRNHWFPATLLSPKTAATMRLLNHFQYINFESKVSVFEFYRGLMRETDNTHLSEPKMRYEEFLRMIRVWRFLKMMKRLGRGHAPGGISATKPGECALLCPACPHPGKNLRDDWESRTSERWLFRLFLGIDANFKLQHGLITNAKRDQGLMTGLSYFVPEAPYKNFLRTRMDLPQERSTCVSHSAVNNANSAIARGVDVTGVGTVDCARHTMKRPCSVGDLQKGERYVNIDYIFFLGLLLYHILPLVISYDIACQWIKNLWARMKTYPIELQMDPPDDAVYVIPKFHAEAHVEKCRTNYSLNLEVGVGRTDGEAPERGWANVNRLASSTKEMTTGARHDTLDDHFGDWNWKKIVMMGDTFLQKIQQAVENERQCLRLLEEFEESLEEESQSLSKWREEVQHWERTKIGQNPYEVQASHKSLADVRLQLAEEDQDDFSEQLRVEDVSPSLWITTGLDIEEQQRRLALDKTKLGLHATALQHAKLLERTNALQRKLDAWRSIQSVYLPGASVIRVRESMSTPVNAKSTPVNAATEQLYLPSQIAMLVSCDVKLMEYEWQLRFAQAHDSLCGLRNNLRIRAHLYKSKRRFVRGVAANTRAQNNITRHQEKIDACVNRYRKARDALTALAPHLDRIGWEHQVPELRPEDVRGLQDDEVLLTGRGKTNLGEGKRRPSWIWTETGAVAQSGKDAGLHHALRIEWCKSRARAMRWSEEVLLLQEEMRRVVAFLTWQAGWWEERRTQHEGLSAAEVEGMMAYASRQAALRLALRDKFASQWDCVPAMVAEGKRHPEVQGDSVA